MQIRTKTETKKVEKIAEENEKMMAPFVNRRKIFIHQSGSSRSFESEASYKISNQQLVRIARMETKKGVGAFGDRQFRSAFS